MSQNKLIRADTKTNTGTGDTFVFATAPSLTTPRVITSIDDTNGNELFKVTATTSAQNEITLANAASLGTPSLTSTGGDTNIGILIAGKGTGEVKLGQATSSGVMLVADQPILDSSSNELIKFVKTASAVNEITVTNSATGNSPVISSTGGDTNIDLTLTPKGSGGVILSSTKDIRYDATPDTDDTFNGSSTNSFNAGGTVAQWDCVYLTSSSTWALTDADAIGTAGNVMITMATASGTNGNPLRVALPGSFIRNDAWAWTVGGVLYLDTATPGGMTQTVPSGTDDAVKIVGHAVTADVIYFNPSVNWIIRV